MHTSETSGAADDGPAGTGRPPARRPRLLAIDALRGAAVIAMVVYHTAWDLSSLLLVETDVTESRPWSWFARAIAASFLTLSGIGLVLADRSGAGWRPVLRRLGTIGLAAAAVTAASLVAFPEAFIFFGVLHNIAVSSLVALPFLRVGPAWAALAAILLWAAAKVEWPALLDAPPLSWLGLGAVVPITNDWVPIAPWTGFVLAGVALAKLAGPRLAPRPSGRGGPALRALAALGRRSLLVYLVHQPLIFGALSGLRELTGPNPAAEAAPFTSRCVESCRASGPDEATCRASCGCTQAGLRREGLWAGVLANRLTPAELARAQELFRTCLRGARGDPPTLPRE